MSRTAKLVIGPTNAGKSTFLKHINAQNVAMSRNFQKSSVNIDYIHYNFLHFKSFDKLKSNNKLPEVLEKEPILNQLLQSGIISEAIFIVSPIDELIERCRSRKEVEPNFGEAAEYERTFWMNAIQETNLFELYDAAFKLFDQKNIKISVKYNSKNSGSFVDSDRTFIAENLRGNFVEAPPKSEIDELLQFPGVRYQTVQLPHGYDTSSQAYRHVRDGRDSTFNLLRRADFRGKSILDLGCALGDMLYKSERLGATRLLGVELRPDTYEAATRIASLLRSRAEIVNSDFMSVNLDEEFDDVYVLNVIHHVPDFRSFLIKAAKLAKERVIIEYPSFRDPLFRRLGRVPSRLSKLPIVGVSHSSVDQTFVFAPPAIERILSEAGDFKMELLKSPIKGRYLSIFHRSA